MKVDLFVNSVVEVDSSVCGGRIMGLLVFRRGRGRGRGREVDRLVYPVDREKLVHFHCMRIQTEAETSTLLDTMRWTGR